jgi:RNA polymerase sigma-70 factor (ECF subfamily)
MALRSREEVGDLYRRLWPTIYRRCLRLLADAEGARDATQEVFVRVLEHAGELREDRAYLPWLYRVATNFCLDRLRQRLRRVVTPSSLAPESSTPGHEYEVGLRQLVGCLLDGVDEQSQQIAVHAFLDGMTQEEIATAMGLTRRTVGKKLAQLRDRAERLQAEAKR